MGIIEFSLMESWQSNCWNWKRHDDVKNTRTGCEFVMFAFWFDSNFRQLSAIWRSEFLTNRDRYEISSHISMLRLGLWSCLRAASAHCFIQLSSHTKSIVRNFYWELQYWLSQLKKRYKELFLLWTNNIYQYFFNKRFNILKALKHRIAWFLFFFFETSSAASLVIPTAIITDLP